LSYAPVNVETKAELAQQLAGWNGKPDISDLDFSSIGEYLDRVDQGAALNVATLIPHGTLRMLVMGAQARYANQNELAEMKTITEISMKEGAVGLSAGLTYTPAIYAHDEEIIELCKTVADHGGFYAPHPQKLRFRVFGSG
jgi:N-acyl-D-amino-acid deacylase